MLSKVRRNASERRNPTQDALAPTVIDLFAGAGGLSAGLVDAGFRTVYANEVQDEYALTYAHNHPDTLIETRSIREVNAREVRKRIGFAPGELDLLAGGPPCQGFSINAPLRSSSDQRNNLFREYLRFVEEFAPRAILIENVPGLVSFERGETLSAILDALANLGYQSDVRILYAPDYGVPQTRWRTIIIGTRDLPLPDSAFPYPAHNAPRRINFTSRHGERNLVVVSSGDELASHTTVRDALSDLPVLKNGELGKLSKRYRRKPQNSYQALLRGECEQVLNHEATKLGPVNLERLRHIPPGGNWTDIPHELLPAGMKRARLSDHTKRYGRVHPDGLASTILTKCDPHWGAYFHYEQDRTFTVREAARLQSFPDRFIFLGSRVAQYEQVGNAVPPLLAKAIGSSIIEALSGSRRSPTKPKPAIASA